MKQVQLSADIRTTLKKNAMNRLRDEKKVPAVLYGQGNAAISLQLNDKDVFHAFQSVSATNVLIKLKIQGGEKEQVETVMVKEMQRHPVTSRLMHVDFVKISMDKLLETAIPVVVTGIAKGTKEGGMLELVHRDLMVRCLPNLLPENISIDVTNLGITDAITVGEIQIGEGIEILVDAHEPIVHVIAPRVEETKTDDSAAAGAAAAAEVKQPEVIGEKEREERRAEKEKK